MKFDTPATTNAIDALTVVGQPVDRIDGPLKVSGRAPYAHERHDVVANQAHGVVLGAGIAKGRIASMDTRRAEAAPGVRAVVTAANAGTLARAPRNTAKLLGGPAIDHYHQAIALVVADTFEQARAAAALIDVEYTRVRGQHDLASVKDAGKPAKINSGPADTRRGDFHGAFAAAPVKYDGTFTTPDHSHAMMEPHASIAAWNGDELTLWTSNQMIDWCVGDLALTLGIPKEKVHVMSPYIGGGFGGKLFVRADALLAALGARAARRPVRVALQRPLIINNTTHRPATIQRIRIGATADGRITAIGHESWSGDLPGGKPDGAVQQTRLLYAGANRMTATRLSTLDLPEGNAMRAPGEASGMMALEIAIDEMAEKLGLDPIEFRLRNDTDVDPERPERKYSLRSLAPCFREGAARFGWAKRAPKPGATRDGRWLVGLGVAAGYRGAPVQKSAARVRVDGRGGVIVETDMTDIRTGSYTIIGQTAAEMLGVPVSAVTVRLGDSRFPVSAGSGGQWGANSSTAGVYAACVKLREQIAAKHGVAPDALRFADGRVQAGTKDLSLGEAVGADGMVAEDAIEFGDLAKRFQQSTFAAHFCEIAVDAATGETRVRRMLAVCAAGRILNPKTARSQVIGAMTMALGAALSEELVVDKRLGYFVNHDLAGYEVPVHADVPHQDVVFLDETDPMASPMKAKGVGELGICGAGAAIANAIWHATGVRVRDYPIRLDRLLPKLPALA